MGILSIVSTFQFLVDCLCFAIAIAVLFLFQFAFFNFILLCPDAAGASKVRYWIMDYPLAISHSWRGGEKQEAKEIMSGDTFKSDDTTIKFNLQSYSLPAPVLIPAPVRTAICFAFSMREINLLILESRERFVSDFSGSPQIPLFLYSDSRLA